MPRVSPVCPGWPTQRRRLSHVLAWVALTVAPLSARAEPSTSERNLAEQLFVSGRKLMAEGQYAEACSKLAESQRIDSAGGTILNLAICHQMQGRYATAWSELREALSLARKDGRRDRERLALDTLAEVEPLVSHVVVTVEANTAVAGLKLSLDGVPIGPAVWGSPMPVDPGDHEIVASAPGKQTLKVNLSVAASPSEQAVAIPALRDGSAVGGPARRRKPNSVDDHDSMAGVSADPNRSPSKPHDTNATAALVAFTSSGVALTVGTVLGVVALRKRHQSDAYCSGTVCSQMRGVELNDDARRLANYANVSLGVGVAAAAAGVYFVLSGSAKETDAPRSAKLSADKRRLQLAPEMGASHLQLRLSGTW